MKNEEHEVQKAICNYLDIRKVCYWAVPNGGNRSKSEAGRLKAEGVKAGVPDITVYLSKAQKNMIKIIEDVGGGSVKVVYSVADVILWLNTEVQYETK